MKKITVKTQKELDSIKDSFEGEIQIAGEINIFNRLFVNASVSVIVGGEISYVKGGKISYVEGGEIYSVEGGEIYSVKGGKIYSVFGIAVIVNVSVELKNVFGDSVIMNALSGSKINAYGNAIIKYRKSEKNVKITLSGKGASCIEIPDFEPNFESFKNNYPVETKGKNAILYKAVHKKDGKYFSDYDNNIEYAVGDEKISECSKDTTNSCGVGLHVSFRGWAVSFGADWSDMAILECEVPIKDIVVSKDCDGKVRTSKLKVLREVPKEEW